MDTLNFFFSPNPLVRNNLEGDDLSKARCVLAGLAVAEEHVLGHGAASAHGRPGHPTAWNTQNLPCSP